MALVAFKDLCIDTTRPHETAAQWGPRLGLDIALFRDGDARLTGPTSQHTIWLNHVPEARTVKQRVHLDLRARLHDFAEHERVGEPGRFMWTTLVDDELGEFCVFDTDEPPAQRLKAVEVDAADHDSIAAWWHRVLGGRLSHWDDYASVEDVPGMPGEGFDFATVPEPKTVKNRVHWDVTLEPGVSIDDLVDAGATVLRRPDREVHWTVMADPEGNEFCVFAPD